MELRDPEKIKPSKTFLFNTLLLTLCNKLRRELKMANKILKQIKDNKNNKDNNKENEKNDTKEVTRKKQINMNEELIKKLQIQLKQLQEQ